MIDGGDGRRHTSDETPRRSRKVVNPHRWPVCAKIAAIGGGEREPIQDSIFGTGHYPTKPKPGIGEDGVLRPQARMRYISVSSTGLGFVDPLRSCSVAGSGTRDRMSTLQFTFLLRLLSVYSNAVR